MSDTMLIDRETGNEVKEVAKVIITIVTPDEALNDRMDAAICAALDALMTPDTCYGLQIEWKPQACPECGSTEVTFHPDTDECPGESYVCDNCSCKFGGDCPADGSEQ